MLLLLFSYLLSSFEKGLGRENEYAEGRSSEKKSSRFSTSTGKKLKKKQFSLGACFGALIAFLAFFHIASYFCLRTLYKARR